MMLILVFLFMLFKRFADEWVKFYGAEWEVEDEAL